VGVRVGLPDGESRLISEMGTIGKPHRAVNRTAGYAPDSSSTTNHALREGSEASPNLVARRLAAGGWRLAAGGWRLEAGSYRSKPRSTK
jgi:hypothetical protein